MQISFTVLLVPPISLTVGLPATLLAAKETEGFVFIFKWKSPSKFTDLQQQHLRTPIKLKQSKTRYQYHVKCLITIPHLPMERTHTQPQTFILAVWPFRIPTWLPTLGRRWVAIVGPVGWQLMDRTVGFPQPLQLPGKF
jgi:hypothetical protein